jgi:hypothetical protein
MKNITHVVDFCVVGGGLAGLSAAVAAARRGLKVALMQDRPVPGGNSSSEIRMWVCGAHGEGNRETGIIEEIHLDNMYRNPGGNWQIWDSVLYEKARYQENLTLLLNCSCNAAQVTDNIITSVTGWQLTTETTHTVQAKYFADCSGDSTLAHLVGAEYRIGHEARAEFNEDIAPEMADRETMGMSCLIQAREMSTPQKFIPPTWAQKFPDHDSMSNRGHEFKNSEGNNFWWIELGGVNDSIHDTEMLRDELLKIAFGIWDHIKNQGDHGADNWVLEWIGFLPGKRESRRCIGDVLMNQHDVRAGGVFDDVVAYGGWSMDDHHPGGFWYPGHPTIFHPAPSPFGIPYRALYSKNIDNLWFAGRNISMTHVAMSSSRVMATCATLGQAVGTAVAIAKKYGLSPRGVYETAIKELQNELMNDDCYLPGMQKTISEITKNANIVDTSPEKENLRNGINRSTGNEKNYWRAKKGESVEYSFVNATEISEISLVFDSNLDRRQHNQPCCYPLDAPQREVPATMVKSFVITGINNNGIEEVIAAVANNYQRFVKINATGNFCSVKLKIGDSWGNEEVNVFCFEVK